MKQSWATDLDGACERSGDFPSIGALPRIPERQQAFVATITELTGRKPEIKPFSLKRLFSAVEKTPAEELAKLQKLIQEILK